LSKSKKKNRKWLLKKKKINHSKYLKDKLANRVDWLVRMEKIF
jgi:hypothetical protein